MDGDNVATKGLHEAVLDALKSPIVAIDRKGTVVEWNRAAELCTGINRQDALGREIWDLNARVAPAIVPYEDALVRSKNRFTSLVALSDQREMGWREEFDWEILSTSGEERRYHTEAFPVVVDRAVVIVSVLEHAQNIA